MIVYNNVSNRKISYTARCPQVRDANWVCNAFNSQFPNFSITKHKPIFEKEAKKLFAFEENGTPLDIEAIYDILYSCTLTKEDFKLLPLKNKIMHRLAYMFLSKERKTNLRHLGAIKNAIIDFADKRESSYNIAGGVNKPLGALYFLRKHKMGNCYESAMGAKIILRLNGISNSEVISLKNVKGQSVHTVCVFNTDGSKFKGFTNKSIIIDPWIGKADFAQNIMQTYRNEYSNYFAFKAKGMPDIEFKKLSGIYKKRLQAIKKAYPELIFRSKNRHFMKADKTNI